MGKRNHGRVQYTQVCLQFKQWTRGMHDAAVLVQMLSSASSTHCCLSPGPTRLSVRLLICYALTCWRGILSLTGDSPHLSLESVLVGFAPPTTEGESRKKWLKTVPCLCLQLRSRHEFKVEAPGFTLLLLTSWVCVRSQGLFSNAASNACFFFFACQWWIHHHSHEGGLDTPWADVSKSSLNTRNIT